MGHISNPDRANGEAGAFGSSVYLIPQWFVELLKTVSVVDLSRSGGTILSGSHWHEHL